VETANRTAIGFVRTWCCLVPAMCLPFAAALLYFVLLAGKPVAWAVYTGTKFFTALWPLLCFVLIENGRMRWTQGIDWRRHLAAVPLGLLSGAAIAGVMIGAFELTPLGDHVRAHSDAIRSKVGQLGLLSSLQVYLLFGVFLSGIHSLLEEYYWRWFVFGRLDRVCPRAVAYLLAGLSFAGHHYVVLSGYLPIWSMMLFGTFVGAGGIFWCWLYRRQQTLVGCWVSHLIVDVAVFTIGYRVLFAS
jgi:hypothetical protein